MWIKNWLPNGSFAYAFSLAGVCWAIWKARNRAFFMEKNLKHPVEIISHACSLMKYWTGLYSVEQQAALADGVQWLLSFACGFLSSHRNQQRLTLGRGDEEEDEQLDPAGA